MRVDRREQSHEGREGSTEKKRKEREACHMGAETVNWSSKQCLCRQHLAAAAIAGFLGGAELFTSKLTPVGPSKG